MAIPPRITGPVPEQERQTITEAYAAFNARRIEAVLALLHPEVDWPNGMEGGYLKGLRAVSDYWLRQWAVINPHVAPVSMEQAGGRIRVVVHQTIRDLAGSILREGTVHHLYTFADQRIRRMDIEKIPD